MREGAVRAGGGVAGGGIREAEVGREREREGERGSTGTGTFTFTGGAEMGRTAMARELLSARRGAAADSVGTSTGTPEPTK